MSTKKQHKKPFHEEFAERVIAMLEAGTAPWQRPWEPAENLAPRNPISGTVYKGVNRLNLSLSTYEDPRWMTLKQANDAGYRIKAGSHSTPVVFYQFTKELDKLDAQGQPVLGPDGQPVRETWLLDRPIMRMARVFNAEQVEGFPALEHADRQFAWEPQEKAEKILAASGAQIKHDQSDSAFYRPLTDAIHLPPKTSFDAGDKYYATALHELGHWTGHPSRLNRKDGPRGTEAYAKEELRAEIGAWMTGQDIGVGHDPGQHAAYVKSWVQILRDEPLEILCACRDAEHIRSYILGLEMEKEKQLSNDQQIAHVSPVAQVAPVEHDMRMTAPSQKTDPALGKTWLFVPYKEKNAAKALGARWDATEKQWYAPEGTDLAPLRPYLSVQEKARNQAVAANLSPQEEFARKLADLGLDLKGQMPDMDGKLHRVPLLTKNGHGLDGAYCLHGDGVPAGWAQNHVTGERVNLVASGVVLSPEAEQLQREERAARLKEVEQERARQHDEAAIRCQALWNQFNGDVTAMTATPCPYLERKGVEAFGLKEDQGNLIVPLHNVDGVLRGFQAIAPDGQKSFAAGMEKKGNFHLITSQTPDPSRDGFLLCEGYATGASLHMATGKPVVVAFDSGNLLPVAEALRVKYPDAALTICADNDHALTRDGQPYNVGIEKARQAAQLVNARLIFPEFSQQEKARGLTDFNDLHQARGLDAVKKQLGHSNEKTLHRDARSL